MAGVLNKPDALNFSGNMNQFLLSSTGLISFVLKKGNQTLLEQSYEPGPDLMVRIDLKDVIEGQLSYNLDAGSLLYVQPNLAETFTAVVDGAEYSFRVVRGGVADLADTAANWLKLHFLTWQPRVKQVTYYSPEWLTYYATEACSVKLKATYPDKTTKVIPFGNCIAGCATTINMQYSVIAGKLGNTYPSFYEVWIEKTNGTKLSESQIYAFSDPISEDEQWFLFENSLGGLDTFRAGGSNNLAAEHEHSIAEFNEVREEYQVDTQRKYVKNTGWLDQYTRRWLLDFFPSKKKYVYEADSIRRIVVTESNATYVSNDLPSYYTFTWQLAEVSTYLNLIKNANDIPDNLVAPDLSSPDFILPPRLAEFPRVTLSEGVLIPAFDLFSSIPTVTTYGAIHNTIKNAVVKELEDEIAKIGDGSGSGGGGGSGSNIEIIKLHDLTEPTDLNVFSSLRTLEEINSLAVEIYNKYLRRDIDDRANGTIEFAKNIVMVGEKDFSIYSNKQANSFNESGFKIWADGDAWFGNLYAKKSLMVQGNLSSPNFASGFPAGYGWAITWRDVVNAAGVIAKKTHLEIDDATFRGILRVYEFVLSQVLGENGTRFTADMMKVKSVDIANKIIYLDTEEGLLYNPFWTDDIVMVQQFNGMPTPENNYYVTKQYEFTVEETHIGGLNDGENRVDWIKYKNFVGDESQIAARDTIVRVDNETNPDRKGVIKQTSVEPGSPYQDIIYGMKTDPEHAIRTRTGKLEGLITPYWGQLKGYGTMCDNLYARGHFMLHTGEDVKTKFEIVEGRLESEMSAIRQEISDKDNVLSNSSFASDTDKWDVVNEVSFFTVSRKFLFFNNSFYSDKRKVASVVSTEGRRVLRLKKSKIVQKNEYLKYKPEKQLELEDGTLIWPTYYISFRYRVKTAGNLTIGFPGQNLYQTVHLESGSVFENYEVSGAWDGTGDFELSFSGDIEIYSLAMAANSLEDFKTEFLTRITQTEKEILLHAEKIEQVGKRLTTTEGNISVMAGDINIWASRVTKVEGRMSSAEYSIINVIPDQISAVSSRVTVNERGITSLWQAGFLTKTTAEGALAGIFASKNSVTAASIIATVNNAGQGTVKIKADRIELDGKTIINIVETNSITTSKLTVTDGAKIGGFTVNSYRFVNSDGNAGLDVIYSGTKFVYVNSRSSTAMIAVRNDGGTCISATNYVYNGRCLDLLANKGSHAIYSIGPAYLAFRDGESLVIDLVYTSGQIGNIRYWGIKDKDYETNGKSYSGQLRVHYVDGRKTLIIQ